MRMRAGREEEDTWIWIAAKLGKRNVLDVEEVADRIGRQATTGTAGEERERRGGEKQLIDGKLLSNGPFRMCPLEEYNNS
jgi:hypothetical protein